MSLITLVFQMRSEDQIVSLRGERGLIGAMRYPATSNIKFEQQHVFRELILALNITVTIPIRLNMTYLR